MRGGAPELGADGPVKVTEEGALWNVAEWTTMAEVKGARSSWLRRALKYEHL